MLGCRLRRGRAYGSMTDMQPLEHKIAVVTGAGGTIGRGVCLALAEAGADVAAFDIESGPAHEVAELVRATGRRAMAEVFDLTDPHACAAAVEHVDDELGGIDILVNLAQRFRILIDFCDVTDDDMNVSWESGPLATFRMMQLCHPKLVARGGGSIVNFGSGVGTMGTPRYAPYAVAKEAVRTLSRVAAQEWGPDLIRVNTICPAATADPDNAEWVTDEVLAGIPLGRIGDPQHDIGAAVIYLAGAGSYVTGQTLMVDGGTSGHR